MIDRTQRELTDENIKKIAETYHAWRGDKGADRYEDVAGFCKVVRLEVIAKHSFVLTPGRYVGTEAVTADDESLVDRIAQLTNDLHEQFRESHQLELAIRENLKRLRHASQ